MSLENSLTSCPLCKCTLNDTVNRLIKEFCGHLKCRACLVNENNGCGMCFELRQKGDGVKRINGLILSEEQNIVYDVSTNSMASDYCESGSDKLQIDTESDTEPSFGDGNIYNIESTSQTKPNFLNVKKTDKVSRRSRALYSHILSKSNEAGKYFECSVCKKKFTSRGHRHYHLFCNKIDKPLKCDICSKEFITKFHYNYHLETHQKNITFKCPKCDKTYLRSNSLRKHLQKHSIDWKQFVCSDCGARFQSSSQLKLHENKHKNIYPFECDKCDRKFMLKSNLQNHHIVHLKEKRFACDLCGKKFARKGALRLHNSSHLDERPYECKYCNKRFTHQRIYIRHLTIHLGKNTFNCPFCDAKCSRKDNFYRHLRNLHPNSNYKELNQDLFEPSSDTKTLETKDMCKISSTANVISENDSVGESIMTDIQNSDKVESQRNAEKITILAHSDGPNSVNVIQSIGNVKPITVSSFLNLNENDEEVPQLSPTGLLEYRSEIAKEICQITNQINSTPIKRVINVIKSKKPYDPIEIYRKILMPNDQDEEYDEQKISNLDENSYNQLSQKDQDMTKDLFQKPPPIDFSEVHWRKRTSQYFLMK